jgi:uncharacterized protein (DUF983 family)
MIISLFLPTVYIVIGAIVSVTMQLGTSVYINNWVKLYILAYFMTIAYSFNTSQVCGSIVAER